MCRPCRAARPKRDLPVDWRDKYKNPCIDCGRLHSGKFRCRECYNAHQKLIADPEAAKQRKKDLAARTRRDKAAPGLSIGDRRKLLARWRKQGKACIYCSHLVECVDHVVPLARGGTNFEGNLAPCCRSCNLAKSHQFVSYWRRKRKQREALAALPEPVVVRKAKQFGDDLPMLVQCEGCPEWFTPGHGRRFCSTRCNQARRSRDVLGHATTGTQRQCQRCDSMVIVPRRTCDDCRARVLRAAKARRRKKWKQTPAGKASRRRQEARRLARKRAQVGGTIPIEAA